MKFDDQLTDKAFLLEIGTRIRQIRLNKNLSRSELAALAAVSEPTIARAESGKSIQIVNLIRICRPLGILRGFEVVFPPSVVSPVQLLKLEGKKRQRATGKRAKKPQAPAQPWTWGDNE